MNEFLYYHKNNYVDLITTNRFILKTKQVDPITLDHKKDSITEDSTDDQITDVFKE